jgi:hypothetical protein
MRKTLIETALVVMFVALTSAGLFIKTNSFKPAANRELEPIDCSVPVDFSIPHGPCRQ